MYEVTVTREGSVVFQINTSKKIAKLILELIRNGGGFNVRIDKYIVDSDFDISDLEN